MGKDQSHGAPRTPPEQKNPNERVTFFDAEIQTINNTQNPRQMIN
jgi:hypothetical protein